MKGNEAPFACDMTAIAPEQRGAHLAAIQKLFQSVTAIQELPNGYAFQLPNESDLLRLAGEFVTLERLCCPFFGFSIEVGSEDGGVCLKLTGREGIKPFIMAEIGGTPASLTVRASTAPLGTRPSAPPNPFP